MVDFVIWGCACVRAGDGPTGSYIGSRPPRRIDAARLRRLLRQTPLDGGADSSNFFFYCYFFQFYHRYGCE